MLITGKGVATEIRIFSQLKILEMYSYNHQDLIKYCKTCPLALSTMVSQREFLIEKLILLCVSAYRGRRTKDRFDSLR